MPSGREERREQNFEHTTQSQPADQGSGEQLAPDVLRQIVAQTASDLAKPEAIDPALKAAMLEVARQYAGQPLVVDAAGTALLEAVLRVQVPALAQRPRLLSRTARIVATSLLNDPAARLRIEHLWATLAEEAA